MERGYDDYKRIIDEHLLDFIPNIDNKSISLYEAMKYSLNAGGKRIRPVLLLATCDFCGGKIEEVVWTGVEEDDAYIVFSAPTKEQVDNIKSILKYG